MIDLNKLETLFGATTPGAWEGKPKHSWYLTCQIISDSGKEVCAPGSADDAALIVAMHNALPELIRLARLGQRAEAVDRSHEELTVVASEAKCDESSCKCWCHVAGVQQGKCCGRQ